MVVGVAIQKYFPLKIKDITVVDEQNYVLLNSELPVEVSICFECWKEPSLLGEKNSIVYCIILHKICLSHYELMN